VKRKSEERVLRRKPRFGPKLARARLLPSRKSIHASDILPNPGRPTKRRRIKIGFAGKKFRPLPPNGACNRKNCIILREIHPSPPIVIGGRRGWWLEKFLNLYAVTASLVKTTLESAWGRRALERVGRCDRTGAASDRCLEPYRSWRGCWPE